MSIDFSLYSVVQVSVDCCLRAWAGQTNPSQNPGAVRMAYACLVLGTAADTLGGLGC